MLTKACVHKPWHDGLSFLERGNLGFCNNSEKACTYLGRVRHRFGNRVQYCKVTPDNCSWRCPHLFLPSCSPYLKVPGDSKTGYMVEVCVNDPTLLVVVLMMWPLGGREKNVSDSHNHMQFSLLTGLQAIPKAL